MCESAEFILVTLVSRKSHALYFKYKPGHTSFPSHPISRFRCLKGKYTMFSRACRRRAVRCHLIYNIYAFSFWLCERVYAVHLMSVVRASRASANAHGIMNNTNNDSIPGAHNAHTKHNYALYTRVHRRALCVHIVYSPEDIIPGVPDVPTPMQQYHTAGHKNLSIRGWWVDSSTRVFDVCVRLYTLHSTHAQCLSRNIEYLLSV